MFVYPNLMIPELEGNWGGVMRDVEGEWFPNLQVLNPFLGLSVASHNGCE